MNARLKKTIKWITGTCLACVIVIVLAAVSLGFWLKTDHGRQTTLNLINGRIPGEILMDGMEFSLFRGELEIHGLGIQSPENEPVIKIEKLFVTLNFSRLHLYELAFGTIQITNPYIHLIKKKSGNLNLISCFTGSDKKATVPEKDKNILFPFNVILNSLSVTNGRFIINLESEQLFVDTGNISITGSGNLAHGMGRIRLSTGSSKLMVKGKEQPITEKTDLSLAYEKGFLTLEKLAIASKPASLNLKGSVSGLPHKPKADLFMDIVGDLEKISQLMPDSVPMTGILKANTRVKGTLAHPQATLSVDYAGGKIASRPLGQADIKLSLDNSILTLEKLIITHDGGKMTGKGNVDLTGAFPRGVFARERHLEKLSSSLSFKADKFQPGIFLSREGLDGAHGICSFEVNLDGTLNHPEVRLQLTAKNAGYGDYPRSDAHMEFLLSKDHIVIKRLALKSKDSNLNINGDLDLTQAFPKGLFAGTRYPENLSGSLSLKADRLQPGLFLSSKSRNKVHGTCSFEARIDGNLKNPEARLKLTAEDAGYENFPRSDANIELLLSKNHLMIKRLALASRDSKLNITGNVKVMEKGSFLPHKKMDATLHLISTKIMVEDFIPKDKDIKGELAIKGDLTGTLLTPKASVNLSGKNIQIAKETASDLTIKANLDNSVVKGEFALKGIRIMEKPFKDFNGTLIFSQKIARIHGDLGFDIKSSLDVDSMDFTTDLIFKNSDLLPFLTLAGINDVQGLVTGKIEVKGNIRELEKINGETRLEKLSLNYKGEYGIASHGIRARIDGNKIELFPVTLSFTGNGVMEIEAKGRIDEEIEILARGKIPAKAGELFTNAMENIEGYLTIKTRAVVRKEFKKSSVTSRIELHDIGMTIAETDNRIHGINGLIIADPERIEIPSIRGKLNTGNFLLSGNATLKELFPEKFQAKLQGTALPVVVADTMEASINADLTFAGTPEKSLLGGNITLQSGEWTKDFNLERSALENLAGLKRKEQKAISANRTDNLAETMELDLLVKAKTPFMVKNNMADIEVNPDLRIKGSVDNPFISGRATLTPGTITYRGKEFELTTGVVEFTNPYGIHPELDIVAEYEVSDREITLQISGTPDNLILTLSSDPQEEHGDIVSLLLTGKTTTELIESEGGSTTSPASLLTGMAASSFGGKLQKAAGLDILEVEVKENNENTSFGDVNFKVGKELTEKITVAYSMKTKEGIMIQKTSTEYKLSDKVSISGFQDTEGIYGAELRYRLEFK